MSFTESIAAGRAFARQKNTLINAKQEVARHWCCVTLGGAFFSVMQAGGGTSKTAVVHSAGGLVAASPHWLSAERAAGHHAVAGAGLRLMPNATLAAVVMVYWVGLIKLSEFVAYLQRAHDGIPLGRRRQPGRACCWGP